MIRLLKMFEAARPFSEAEAWMLFRIAAIGEAGGWTLLLTGMGLKRFVLHGNNIPVLIAGQFHGLLFFAYIVAALGLYPCLHWSRTRAVVAGLAGVPPYGSLLFEQWAAHRRRAAALKTYSHFMLYTFAREPAGTDLYN
jgi:integral membrane protein